ncbi:MAG: ethanolamine utilization protein EutN [Candidatus Omnitrophota bacterium]|jgi:microcompartment protein CcmK/EutM|nr:MAG: ethanolamine utilization protein EutN [Candidatus Omnitrophota bacterium]
MRLARIVGNVVSTLKHEAYDGKKLLLAEPIHPTGEPSAPATVAVDYVGAGEGELVLLGAAPGAAKLVFGMDIAPIKDMVMGIIDEVELEGEITLRASDANKSAMLKTPVV